MPTLTFYGWTRSGVYGSAAKTSPPSGRLQGSLTLRLKNRDLPSEVAQETVSYLIMGPGDVSGLDPRAIARTVPPAGGVDAQTTRAVQVDFTEIDLPWRYTPEPHSASNLELRPWLVLVVGTEDEITLQPGGLVTLAEAVRDDHPLADSARWAHIQEESGRKIARLLSPRTLVADTTHVAAIVPAFTAQGNPWWTPGVEPPPSPCYHSWTFTTGEAGDFRSLAARLTASAESNFGTASVEYQRTTPPVSLALRGALAPIPPPPPSPVPAGYPDPPLPGSVSSDMAALTAPLTDSAGRPVIGLPDHGAPWVEDPSTTTWGGSLNADPRHRGAAGLGLWAGVELEETIAATATAQVGAVEIAAQRIRFLTAGLEGAGSLWRRRLPADPAQRLQLYGPSFRRMATGSGTVLAEVAGDDRPLAAAFFSSAARRVLRPGPARTALARPAALAPAALLAAANTCPLPPAKSPAGLPHATLLDRGVLERRLGRNVLDHRALLGLMDKFDLRAVGERVRGSLLALFQRIRAAEAQGAGLPNHALVALLDPISGQPLTDDQLAAAVQRFDETPDDTWILALGAALDSRPPKRPCRPVDLTALEKAIAAAVDPTVAEPLVQRRVLSGITGLDAEPLSPPEICLNLDLPLWRFLRDRALNWLLPGVGELKADSVAAVGTNPKFVDAFLVGFNTQVLGELRWRNYPLSSRCTPARVFWDRIDAILGTHAEDILPVEQWASASALGSSGHQTTAAQGSDLVLVFRSDLFRRYPETLLYVVPAVLQNNQPDWAQNPNLTTGRSFPTFQGRISDDALFFGFDVGASEIRTHWVVLEEPPSGYWFENDTASSAQNGADFAKDVFHEPTRVLIQGWALVPEAGP